MENQPPQCALCNEDIQESHHGSLAICAHFRARPQHPVGSHVWTPTTRTERIHLGTSLHKRGLQQSLNVLSIRKKEYENGYNKNETRLMQKGPALQ